jgi:hypothetical protein
MRVRWPLVWASNYDRLRENYGERVVGDHKEIIRLKEENSALRDVIDRTSRFVPIAGWPLPPGTQPTTAIVIVPTLTGVAASAR